MSTVQQNCKCPKCGSEEAVCEFNCRTSEEWAICEICGWGFQNRRKETWVDGKLVLGDMVHSENAPDIIKVPVTSLRPMSELLTELESTSKKRSKGGN